MIKPDLTYGEATALYSMAERSGNDLKYYKFLSPGAYKEFCRDYKAGIGKLRELIQTAQGKKLQEYLKD